MSLSPEFARLYAATGRPSIPPEQLLLALLLQTLYTIRSERLLMEELNYNLLFRWFVGLTMDDPVWNHSVFSKNRERLLEGDIAEEFMARVIGLAREHGLLSDERGPAIRASRRRAALRRRVTPRKTTRATQVWTSTAKNAQMTLTSRLPTPKPAS